jgi:hypothetical protein
LGYWSDGMTECWKGSVLAHLDRFRGTQHDNDRSVILNELKDLH